VDGEDVRTLPLKERKALLDKVVRHYRMQKSEHVRNGKATFRAVCGPSGWRMPMARERSGGV
jgi:ATP-dependent DNA ligase